MDLSLELKKEIADLLIKKKEELLNELGEDQQEKIEGGEAEDDDNPDTYESTAEQAYDEADMESNSIGFLSEEITALKSINFEAPVKEVAFGALIYTNYAVFLIAAAQKPFTHNGQKIIGLSTDAPLFQKMEGMKAKAEFHFGDIEYVIFDII